FFFYLTVSLLPIFPLFPYTTLFRSGFGLTVKLCASMSIQKSSGSARACKSFRIELRSAKKIARVLSKRLKQLCDLGKARSTSFQRLWRQACRLQPQGLRPTRPPLQFQQCPSPPAGIARIVTSTFARPRPDFSVSIIR